MFISTTNKAWDYLVDLPPHKYRAKSYIQFNGTRFVTIPAPKKSAKGLSSFLQSIFFNPTPNIPNPLYATTPPYQILPTAFTDMRSQDIIDLEYETIKPGEQIPFEYWRMLWYHPNKTDYTCWSNGDPTFSHQLTFPRDLLPYLTPITDYWHLALQQLPRSQVAKFSALLNAIGLRYLDSPVLHQQPTIHEPALPHKSSSPTRPKKLHLHLNTHPPYYLPDLSVHEQLTQPPKAPLENPCTRCHLKPALYQVTQCTLEDRLGSFCQRCYNTVLKSITSASQYIPNLTYTAVALPAPPSTQKANNKPTKHIHIKTTKTPKRQLCKNCLRVGKNTIATSTLNIDNSPSQALTQFSGVYCQTCLSLIQKHITKTYPNTLMFTAKLPAY